MCKDNDDLSKNNNVSDNNGVNGNNGVGSNDSNDVRTSFTDKELEDALLGFEKEFSEEQNRDSIDDACLLYTSPSPRDGLLSRMPSSA